MKTRTEQSRAVLEKVAAAAGLSFTGAQPIRLAENDLWRLPGNVVVRIARGGQEAAATREVAVARWLDKHGIPAVRPLPVEQPVHAGGRAATFWEELPEHRDGTPADLAPLLRRLHYLPLPPFAIGKLDPFVRLGDRLAATRSVSDRDRRWLLNRLNDLHTQWRNLPGRRPECVVHGDAWGGNCAITSQGAVLLDFERTAQGPPEWDLASIAVEHETFGSLSRTEYQEFCDAYGYDVTTWPGYRTLRDIRELRKATFALQIADDDPAAAEQARFRLACLRGQHGERPWGWTAVG
ncbi:phosphotransferase family protein [Streptomyces specialis]|uniref:phosphotransferase family protein n=1 Tax=Streptomyces specialis TaxID=498367 RepID=UPI00073F45DA|nr:aminoglycoside phosphotransferase family protein [Streptomyces specialis]